MPKYKVKREGGDCLRCILFFYSIIFWAANLVLIFLGLWTLLDPRRSYVIDLINFAEGAPTLRYAAFVSVFTGCWGLLIGFVVFCGAHTRIRTLLGWDTLFLSLLFCAGIAMAALALSFRNELCTGTKLAEYLRTMANYRYPREKWTVPVLDTLQFYNQCCGGYNATDYKESFWFITNTLRGTSSYVPYSCCKQAQHAKYNKLIPIDHMCITYNYNSKAFPASVNSDGCHEKLQNVISEHAWIFAGCGIGYSAIMMIGICFTSLLCSKVRYYYHAPDDISEALETQEYH